MLRYAPMSASRVICKLHVYVDDGKSVCKLYFKSFCAGQCDYARQFSIFGLNINMKLANNPTSGHWRIAQHLSLWAQTRHSLHLPPKSASRTEKTFVAVGMNVRSTDYRVAK